MRDPNRIAHLLVLLGRLWKRNPDLRFAQIIEILKEIDRNHISFS